jgi:pimeloyl-ACP methyl ester carboxylesterase
MFINEYGNKGDPTIVLLAPMMVSGSDLYELMKPYFKGAYHVIAPDQGGHGKAGAYISADEEYRALRTFLLENNCTEIELVYGASLGVAVAWRLFFDPAFRVAHAWFDGVALARNASFPEWFMKKMFRSRKKKLAKTHVDASPSLVKMYGYDFAKMMTKNFERITIADIDNICHACCHYDLRKLSDDEQKKLHLDFGEKDFDWKYSRKTVPVYMPYAELVIRPGYQHCGYMAAEPKAYAEQLEAFMGRGRT